MENELAQSLQDIGYTGPLLEPSKLGQVLQDGATSPEFTALASWLTDQIGSYAQLDETVHPTSSPEDANSFLLELSIFLKELECTNKKLTASANNLLNNVQEREILIEYLIVELMTSKILNSEKSESKPSVLTISESSTAKSITNMLTALQFHKPPEDITPEILFKKLSTKIVELVKQVPAELLRKPLFFGELSNDQWDKLNKIKTDFNKEYTIRREMLLQRFDVTVNSFSWSERLKEKTNELNKCYVTKRDAMKREPNVTFAHLLASRDDLAIIEKTSNASVRKNTKSAINSYIIGSVPDRGGRPYEQEPPPPEVPSWQKDKMQKSQNNFGRGGQSGGRGGGRGGGGQHRNNKSVTSNFGQNYNNTSQASSFNNQNFSFGNQVAGNTYRNTNSNRGYNYSDQSSSGYGSHSSSSYQDGYDNYNSRQGYQNRDYGNQGGYERRAGGDYNKGGRNNRGRGGRVQGGWNQGQYNY